MTNYFSRLQLSSKAVVLRSSLLSILVAIQKSSMHFRLNPEPLLQPMPMIVGSQRSGTTLLRMMLDAHSDLAIPPETNFLIPSLRILYSGNSSRRSFCNLLTKGETWPDFGLDENVVLDELARIEPFSVSKAVRCFYRLYAARFQKSRWGDKTPQYLLYMPAIEQLLPEASFIHIIRDGRDVAQSLRKAWFSPSHDIRVLAKLWQRDVIAGRTLGKKCRSYMEVFYEELIRDTPGVLRKICAFCKLDYDPAMETYFTRARERLTEHQARVLADGTLITKEQRLQNKNSVMLPPDLTRVDNWKKTMNREEQIQFVQVAGFLLDQLGYKV